MKKTAILAIVAVLLLSSGLALALDQECERILKMGTESGYSYSEVVQIVSNGNPDARVTHAQMEARLRWSMKHRDQNRASLRPRSTRIPRIASGNNFKFSDKIIQVPPDIERR